MRIIKKTSNTHWGEWIRQRAKALAIYTQEALASAVGVTPANLSRWLQHETAPRLHKRSLMALAKTLQVNEDVILGKYIKYDPFDLSVEDADKREPPQFAIVKKGTNALVQQGESIASTLTDDELMTEIAKRYRVEVAKLRDMFKQFRWISWHERTLELCDELFEPELSDTLEYWKNLSDRMKPLLESLLPRFDAREFADRHHETMPGHPTFQPDELNAESLYHQYCGFHLKNRNYGFFRLVASLRDSWEKKLLSEDDIAKMRKKILEDMLDC